MRAIWTAVAVAMGVGLAAGMASCSQQHAADDHPNATTTVVASTDVWGSVASAVTGDHATVKSIVNSAVDDPHSFEASPADAAAIIDASLVVYNGGGYDQWVDDVLSGHPGVTTVNASFDSRSSINAMNMSVNAIDFFRIASIPPNSFAASSVSTPHSSDAIDTTGGVPQMNRFMPLAGS